MEKLNVLIFEIIDPPPDIEKNILGSIANVNLRKTKDISKVPDKVWNNCDAILAWHKLKYDKNIISKLKKCKVIVRVGVGYDNVDIIEAKKRNIIVCNVPDYGIGEVADHTMALLLTITRGLPVYTQRTKKREWIYQNPITLRLDNKILGIIGLGRIGTAMALRAKVLGMKVIFYDPYIRDGYDKSLGCERVDSLEDIAKRSDIVSLHTPLTDETRNMIGTQFFSKIKKEIILINTARGPIIDLPALEKAMKKGIVMACGLDVLPVEPSNDAQKLIVDYENEEEWLRGRLVVTPHTAFYSPEAFIEMREKGAKEVLRVLRGKKARNCVNDFF